MVGEVVQERLGRQQLIGIARLGEDQVQVAKRLDSVAHGIGAAIPPREGRVRAKRGGGERPAFVTGFSPPDRFAATLPLPGRDISRFTS